MVINIDIFFTVIKGFTNDDFDRQVREVNNEESMKDVVVTFGYVNRVYIKNLMMIFFVLSG